MRTKKFPTARREEEEEEEACATCREHTFDRDEIKKKKITAQALPPPAWRPTTVTVAAPTLSVVYTVTT